MKKPNIIQDKSYAFAVEIVNLCKVLQMEKEYILSRQLVRSGTAIGAIIEEGIGAISRKDFIYKMQLAYKETRETRYWIRLLSDTKYLNINQQEHIMSKAEEIERILSSILLTAKRNS